MKPLAQVMRTLLSKKVDVAEDARHLIAILESKDLLRPELTQMEKEALYNSICSAMTRAVERTHQSTNE